MYFSSLPKLAVTAGLLCMTTSAQARAHEIANSLNPRQSTNTMSGPYTLPPLGYAFNALEPFIDAQTMEIHHDKHHQTYVNNLNNLLKTQPQLSALKVDDLITKLDQVPAENRTGVRNNAGGHSNHSFFWKNLKIGTSPSGALKKAIDRDFGSFEAFQAQFEKAATTVFGSGWAWLVHDGGKLKVVKTANQDSPLMGVEVAGAKGYPILGLDVWEHAYYLKYQNKRPDYIKAFWSVANWDFAAQRFSEGAGGECA